jgi:hypothetical protein
MEDSFCYTSSEPATQPSLRTGFGRAIGFGLGAAALLAALPMTMGLQNCLMESARARHSPLQWGGPGRSPTAPGHALQRQNAENLKQIFPETEYQGLSPNFHIHVSLSELYIPTMGLPFLLEEICGPILGIYKSLTDT